MRIPATCGLWLWLPGLLLGLPAQAFAEALSLRVCQNDAAHVPWRMPEPGGAKARRAGLDFVFLDLLAQRAGLQLQITLAPGRRCLVELRAGQQDAILGISHLPERELDGVYPRSTDGRVDEKRAIRFDQYAWYVPTHAELNWDGRRLLLPRGSLVGVQSSNAIGAELKRQGYRIEDGARTAEATLEKLVRGRVEAAALLSSHADAVLQRVPGWRNQVRRLDPPLERRAYYMIFSHGFAEQRGALGMVGLWQDIVAVRDSNAYRLAESQAMTDMHLPSHAGESASGAP